MISTFKQLLTKKSIAKVSILHGDEDMTPLLDIGVDAIKKKVSYAKFNIYMIENKGSSFNDIKTFIGNDDLFSDNIYLELLIDKLSKYQSELIDLIHYVTDKDITLLIKTSKISLIEQKAKWFIELKQNNNIDVISIGNKDIYFAVDYLFGINNITIDEDAKKKLVYQNYSNMTQLMQQIKLLQINFPKNSSISINDIDIVNNSKYSVFDFSNAYLSGDLKTSVAVFEHLEQNDKDVYLLFLWVMIEDIRKLIILKGFLKQKILINNAIAKISAWGDNAKNLQTAVQRVSYQNLLTILNKLSLLDLKLKGVSNVNIDIRNCFFNVLQLLCIDIRETGAIEKPIL